MSGGIRMRVDQHFYCCTLGGSAKDKKFMMLPKENSAMLNLSPSIVCLITVQY